MGDSDRVEGKGAELKGKIKEKVGDATNNEDLRGEGVADQAGGKAQQAVGDIKNVAKDLKS